MNLKLYRRGLSSSARRVTIPSMRPFRLVLASAVVLVAGPGLSPALGATATAPRIGGTCSAKLIGTVGLDAKGQPLLCTRLTKSKAQWKLVPLGSFERPIPLGQTAETGPVESRFRVRVVRVNFSAAAEILAESPALVAPATGVEYVRVRIEATFAGPAASAPTQHVWYARDVSGADYAASDGCGGGYGSDFDVGVAVPKGDVVAGNHCFEVPAASVSGLRLRVDGYGDRATMYFALR